MHRIIRNLLFALFVLFFFVGAPLVVLYTAGYRYNPVNGQIVRTGVLSVSSFPRGATITLSGKPTEKKTPFVFNRLMPGDYVVTISRDGYHDWQQAVTISSGRTAYASDVMLFLDEAPALLAELGGDVAVPSTDGKHLASLVRTASAAEVWLYTIGGAEPLMVTQYPARASDMLHLTWSDDSEAITIENISTETLVHFDREGISLGEPNPGSYQTVGAITLMPNSQAIEIHDTRLADNPLIALLPLADYRIAEAHDAYAVVIGSNHMMYLIDANAANPIVLSAAGSVYDFSPGLGRFAWSDGIELHTYALSSQTQTFITRQSKAIIAVALHASGNALLISTNDDVLAFATAIDEYTTTRLLADATIFSFWLNEAGDTGYFFGDYLGMRGVFTLPLTK